MNKLTTVLSDGNSTWINATEDVNYRYTAKTNLNIIACCALRCDGSGTFRNARCQVQQFQSASCLITWK